MDFSRLPITFQALIPESYLDEMGHMNVMWYTHLFSEATGGFFDLFGMNRAYFEGNNAGSFALEVHVRYRAEVRAGQRVTVRTRALGRSAKRFHFMHFLILDHSAALSSTGEFVGTHVDMASRRSSPMLPAVGLALDRLIGQHSQLPWDAPVCGIMKP